MNKIRKAGNKGRFYPIDSKSIDKIIDYWNKVIDENIQDKNRLLLKPKAIVCPHAGYIFSGFTANIAYRVLANSNPKRVIVIGPSHHVYVKGISISEYDYYETPYGNLSIDTKYIKKLKKTFNFEFENKAHFLEHSTETQMPFISKYLPKSKVIEIIYGNIEYDILSEIVKDLLRDPENAVVISTDLSHFYSLDKAEKVDRKCLEGFTNKTLSYLDDSCEACGLLGIKAIVKSAIDMNLSTKLLDYRTSSDASGDESKVVGYMSGLVY